MIELLDDESSIERGGRVHVNLSFYIDKQVSQVEKAVKYYRETPVFIKANHILIRLAELCSLEQDASPLSMYRHAEETKREIALMLGITTSTNRGQMHYADFPFEKGYGIASVSNYSIADLFGKDWKTMRPFRMVYRPSSDAYLELPTPSATELKTFGAFSVDIPAFAYMLGGWRNQNNKKSEDLKESLGEFITKYILSSNIIDASRLAYMNLMNDGVSAIKDSNTPFVTVDQTKNIKKELDKLKLSFQQSSIHHANVMAELPCMDYEDIYEAIPEIDMDYLTENNRWFKMLAESQIVLPIVTMTKNENDKDVLLRFRVYTRMLNSNGVLRKSPSDEMNKHLKSIYDETKSLVELRK